MVSNDDTAASRAALAAMTDQSWAADARGLYPVAREGYEAVLDRDPRHPFALSRLLTFDGMDGRFADAERHHQALVEALWAADLDAVHWPYLATIAFQHQLRPLPHALYKAVTRALDRRLAAQPLMTAGKTSAGRRLKVGYLSGLFRDHPVGHVTAALFAAHDRARVEVHVFHRACPPNAYTDTIRKSVEHFVTLPTAPRAMAEAIAAQGLDVLVYIDGYTEVDMLQAVALRPAPVQAFWLGHPGGCDLSAIDCLIADATVVPPGEEGLYDAKVVRLPGPYHCASPQRVGVPTGRAAAGLPEEGLVFCAFNNPEKIDRAVFDCWMNILKRVPDSVLWLSQGPGAAAENFRRAAAERRVDGRRLLFAGRVPDKGQHLARHMLCDLFLDTFTFNAHSTALDALWADLPVLTVEGTRFASRFGAMAARGLGLDALICKSPAEYVERAVRLAAHADELDDLRGQLDAKRETGRLFKMDVFCRGFEDALERIVKGA